MPKIRFGAHMSIAGGLHLAFERAQEAGCEALQIFTKSTGQWKARELSDDEVRVFQERARRDKPAMPVVAHAAYLINVASPNAALREKSLDALFIELERCEALGIPGLVLHPGAHMGAGEAAGLSNLVASLDALHGRAKGFSSRILLETSAGQGSTICRRFGELGEVLQRIREPERVGICIDTCHIFAAGYEVRTREGYQAAMAELEKAFEPSKVHCIHANDSKKDLGSKVDRHQHIGAGCIGMEGFRQFVGDRRWRKLPFIIETPKESDMDRTNLAALRKLQ